MVFCSIHQLFIFGTDVSLQFIADSFLLYLLALHQVFRSNGYAKARRTGKL